MLSVNARCRRSLDVVIRSCWQMYHTAPMHAGSRAYQPMTWRHVLLRVFDYFRNTVEFFVSRPCSVRLNIINVSDIFHTVQDYLLMRPMLETEARTSRPRTALWGRGGDRIQKLKCQRGYSWLSEILQIRIYLRVAESQLLSSILEFTNAFANIFK